jgi:opacity protein-like surface antigen
MVNDHGQNLRRGRFTSKTARSFALSLPEEEFMSRNSFMVLVLALVLAIPAVAADIAGKWTASFDTQIGVQNYTYTFKVDGAKLTGTAESQFGKSEIAEGTVKGDEISFVENLDFQGNALKITYKGKISGDEIKFTRNVADMVTEEFVAKRAK